MPVITKIEAQKKHTDRVNLYLDDEFYAGMYIDVAVKHNLKVGSEIEENVLNELLVESEKSTAYNKVLKYMGSSYKTISQIRKYLSGKDYGKPTIDYVVNKLVEYNYLNDSTYLKQYVELNKSRYGINKLKQNLITRGIPKKLIDESFVDYCQDEDVIYTMALKKLGNKERTYDNLTKTMRFLSAKGFSYDDISKCINRLKKNDDENIYE